MTTSFTLVAPIAPSVTGNGLAMRAGMLLECLASIGPVDLAVVPVSGPSELSPWARQLARQVVVAEPPTDVASSRIHTSAQLGDALLRDRLTRTQPLPDRVRRVPPTLADDVAAHLADAPDRIVVAMREYLAPMGLRLAAALRARRVVIDLDDDAETVLRQLGDDAEADAYGRLARVWFGDADALTAASDAEAHAMTERYGMEVDALPNAARLPTTTAERPRKNRLLLVGNLTYEPNVDAALRLVDDVLPLVRSEHPTATVTLVGAVDDRLDRLRGRPGVEITGQVPDVAPFYDDADLVVVPLRAGAGTRIKVLEAMAHHRPVVATPIAVAGLGLRDGVDVVVAEGPDAMARAVASLFDDPARWSEVADAAFATVTRDHTVESVAPILRRIVLGADDHPSPRSHQA
ncbi:glycosyltransferase family 4 protein [Actinospongicola halichondriae]|uniref:glycosyltransferase family 4 protein n=1 Tax=Actinospongicola halichondriae TaxID=3236844 RepID=UPI003D3B083E